MSARAPDNERGAALIFAIVFTIVIGAIIGAGLSQLSSGLKDRRALDIARDRQYTADAAVETAIGHVRDIGGAGPALAALPNDCEPAPGPHSYTYPAISPTIRVNCTNNPTSTFKGYLQRNVVFTACRLNGTTDCGQATTPVIIRAQVNFEAVGSGPTLVVTGTSIQSWSVNS
jgi:hypothetical protein